MSIRLFAAVGAGMFALAGCQQGQDSHKDHHHPPSEHVQDRDQDPLPGRVKSGFSREFPNATITDIEKQIHPDGAVHWEVRYRTNVGRTDSAEFNPDGTLVPKQ